jgi:hypothetical protein
MFGGNQNSFQWKSLKRAIHHDSRSADGRYRSDSVEDGVKELQLMAFF